MDRVDAYPTGGIDKWDNAAFGGQPQGYALAIPLAEPPVRSPRAHLTTLAVWPNRGRAAAGDPPPAHAIVHYIA